MGKFVFFLSIYYFIVLEKFCFFGLLFFLGVERRLERLGFEVVDGMVFGVGEIFCGFVLFVVCLFKGFRKDNEIFLFKLFFNVVFTV